MQKREQNAKWNCEGICVSEKKDFKLKYQKPCLNAKAITQ